MVFASHDYLSRPGAAFVELEGFCDGDALQWCRGYLEFENQISKTDKNTRFGLFSPSKVILHAGEGTRGAS